MNFIAAHGAHSQLASQSHFFFRIQGLPEDTFEVMRFSGGDFRLSEDYLFRITLRSGILLQPSHSIGKKATLELSWGRDVVPIHGMVSDFSCCGSGGDGFEYEIHLCSVLHPLKASRNNRVFLNTTVPQIIEEVLSGSGISDYELELAAEYPLREFVVQYEESDWEFLTRLCAHQGIFFRFAAGEQEMSVIFHDGVDDLPHSAGGDLLFQAQTGAVRNRETVFALRPRARLLTERVELKDYNYRTPESPLQAYGSNQSAASGIGRHYLYGENIKDLEGGQSLARVRQQALDWQRETFVAESDCRTLAPGEKIAINGHPQPELNGEYLIVEVESQGDQGAAFAGGSKGQGATYRNTLLLIRAGIPYRTPLPERRRVHGLFTARVETTGGEYAYLDEQGRYRVRTDFDLGEAAAGSASHPVRMLQPYGGADHGFHFPLHAGTEVVLSCVNGDLDRPVILGALPNPETPSPVTSANHSQNILRTWGGNELLMEDRQGQEKTELFTRERKNILSLDANSEGHRVRLATEEGEMEIQAAKTILLESGDSQHTESGGDHLVTVENAQRLMTKNKEIELQAATDVLLKAGENIRMQAEAQDIEMSAGEDLVVDAGQSLSMQVRSEDLDLVAEQGQICIQAAKKITVLGQGGGAIYIGQGGGAIEIDPDGVISIDSHTVEIEAQSISIQGGTNSQGGGGGFTAASAPVLSASSVSFSQTSSSLQAEKAPSTAPPSEPTARFAKESRGPASPNSGETVVHHQGIGDGKTEGVDKKAEKPELVIGVFFDGTGNNKDAQPPGKHTNVAKLWGLYESITGDAIYIQGVGTKADDGEMKQSLLGLGMGIGIYGGAARLREAKELVFKALDKYVVKYGPPDSVVFDIFGFSRGAMLARHFVNMVNAGVPDLEGPPVEERSPIYPDLCEFEASPVAGDFYTNESGSHSPDQRYPRLNADVRVRFLGLFDSVGSFFDPGDDDEGYINPHIASSSAGSVYHLTARNEFRKNFPLTSIRGEKGSPDNFVEEEVYGVHSDVGGGYDGTPEKIYLGDVPKPPFLPDRALRYEEVEWEWKGRMRQKAKELGCQVSFDENHACFFELHHTKPELALVSLHAMHAKALSNAVPFRRIDPSADIPKELADLITRTKNHDHKAFKILDDLYIHTSHRQFLLTHFSETIGMEPAMKNFRQIYPNRVEFALTSSVSAKRETK